MRLYTALCTLLECAAQAFSAWAEGERLNTLEHQFEQAELDDCD